MCVLLGNTCILGAARVATAATPSTAAGSLNPIGVAEISIAVRVQTTWIRIARTCAATETHFFLFCGYINGYWRICTHFAGINETSFSLPRKIKDKNRLVSYLPAKFSLSQRYNGI